jgi:hypothetical protein
VYPNPASSSFSIKGVDEPFEISIYNSVGQLLYMDKNVTSTESIEIGNFANGMFLVKAEIEGKTYFRKVLKD